MKRSRKSVRKYHRHAVPSAFSDLLSAGLLAPQSEAERRARCWKPKALAYVALMMSWIDGTSLADRFAAATAAAGEMFRSLRLAGKSYQGFIEALRLQGADLLDKVSVRLRAEIQALPCWTVMGVLAFAVDGSRVECPRTAANQRQLKPAGRKKTGPQLSLTTIYHMGSGCAWDFRIGPGTDSERMHLRLMLAMLPAGATIVADAGFIGYDLLWAIIASGRHVIFRAGANVRLLRKLGYVQVEDDSTVYLWPDKTQRNCQPPLRLRLIRWQGGRHPVTAVTDVVSETELSVEQAGVLYRLRWGVEVFYRSLKQTLSRRKMRSGAPRQAKMELAWAVMGLWVLSLRSVQAITAAHKTPHSLSIALALRQVRRAIAGRLPRYSRLEKLLAAAVKDRYVRRGPKSARDWPHKKNDKPPGAPQIVIATAEQRQKAEQLARNTLAA